MPDSALPCTLVTLKPMVVRSWPGKPPLRNFVIDLEVRNPTSSPIWVLLGKMASGRRVASVSLIGAYAPGFAFVWGFDGVQALDVSPAAEVIFRNIDVYTRGTAMTVGVVLAREVHIAGKPVHEWLGRDGLTPARGTFRVDAPSILATRRGGEDDVLTLDGACDTALAIAEQPPPAAPSTP